MRGIGVSHGVAFGPACLWTDPGGASATAKSPSVGRPQRWNHALAMTRSELESLRQRLQKETGAQEAEILDVQLLMLDDPNFIGEAERLIREGMDPAAAVRQVMTELCGMFASLKDPYLRERGTDVQDLGRRLLRHLQGEVPPDRRLSEPAILVARELTPSDTASLDRSLVLGLVTEAGGPTSHTAILAQAMGIPAVVGCSGLLDQVNDGDWLLVDGGDGTVAVNPDPALVSRVRARQRQEQRQDVLEQGLDQLPAQTQDGVSVTLAANIGGPDDVPAALKAGADGVGLFRTEFLFLQRTTLPDEEEQYRAYRSVLATMAPRQVIIRTLDVGGDKEMPALELAPEANPFLGLRAIRLCLARPELFKSQLRAILRAAVHGSPAIMFPMVATVEDVQAAKALLDEAAAELKAEGVPYRRDIPLGAMIEIPAAAICADQIAPEVDFFSIGSNDLIQYTLAVDRGNLQVADLYQPYHPAVVRLLRMVAEAGERSGRWVGICGQMGGDPLAVPLLLGLGIREISTAPGRIRQIRRIIRSVTTESVQNLVDEALTAASADQVAKLLKDFAAK